MLRLRLLTTLCSLFLAGAASAQPGGLPQPPGSTPQRPGSTPQPPGGLPEPPEKVMELIKMVAERLPLVPPQPYAIGRVQAKGGHPVAGTDDGVLFAPPLTDSCLPDLAAWEEPDLNALEDVLRRSFATSLETPVSLEVTIGACGATAEPEVECAWGLQPVALDGCSSPRGGWLYGNASWTGWQGSVPLTVPEETGTYELILSCKIAGKKSVPEIRSPFFVTYSEPLPVFSPPKPAWYRKATCWGGGLGVHGDESDVLQAILDGIYRYGRQNWRYGLVTPEEEKNTFTFPLFDVDGSGKSSIVYVIEKEEYLPECVGSVCGCYWDAMVADDSPCNFGTCYIFSDVFQAISGVMGVGGLRYIAVTGRAGTGFATKPSESLDPHFKSNVVCAYDDLCYPYVFSSHSLRLRDGRYYDSTFDGVFHRAGESIALNRKSVTNDVMSFLESEMIFFSLGKGYGQFNFYFKPREDVESWWESERSIRFTDKDVTFAPVKNSDGSYAQLAATVEVELLVGGSYLIHGVLLKDDTVVAHQPSYWSTGVSTTLVSGRPGTYEVELKLSGQQILQSGLDGPYKLLAVTHGEGNKIEDLEAETPAYSHDEFSELPAAIMAGSSVEGVAGDSGKWKALRVTVPLKVRASGLYPVGIRLAQGDHTVGYAGEKKNFDPGNHLLFLEIEGKKIAAFGVDGPYTMTIVLYNDRLQSQESVFIEVEGYRATDFL